MPKRSIHSVSSHGGGIEEKLSLMAQEIWFRTDLKHVIEGLALSLVHSQALSGAAQPLSYQHGYLSALISLGSCLGINNLDASIITRSGWTEESFTPLIVSGHTMLVDQEPRSDD